MAYPVEASDSMMFGMNPQHTGDYNSVSGGIIPDGTEKWSFTTGDWVTSSPAVAEGVVYVGSDDTKVYVLDATTGSEKWSFTTGNSVISSPAVADGVVYVGSADTKVYALYATTGTEKWSFTTGSMVFSPPRGGGWRRLCREL